jgi:hypothetical protein
MKIKWLYEVGLYRLGAKKKKIVKTKEKLESTYMACRFA